jgi:hypothetical protein
VGGLIVDDCRGGRGGDGEATGHGRQAVLEGPESSGERKKRTPTGEKLTRKEEASRVA